MENLLQDIRYSIRILLASPGFTAIAILSLALGIGANTAVFSIINTFLLAPLPVREPSRLVSVFTTDVKNTGNLPVSHLNYIDYRDQNDVFDSVLAYTFAGISETSNGGAKPLVAELVSGNYFDALGIQLAKGRGFAADEDKTPGASPVVVLGFGCWQKQFAGDPDILGKTIELNRNRFTVIGVAPADFGGIDLGFVADLWAPLMMHEQLQPGFTFYNSRRGLFLNVIGRLKPGVSIQQAGSAISNLSSELERQFKNDNDGRNARVMSLLQARQDPTGDGSLQLLSTALMAVVGVVLLIACANVANLLLSRAAKREREVAVRLAVGASRGRLIRQLMTESVTLAIFGGIAGVLLAFWSAKFLKSVTPFGAGPNTPDVKIDGTVLAFTGAVAVLCGLLFGLAPAFRASRPDLIPALKGEITIATDSRRFRLNLRKALISLQVALSLFALVTAGLFLRSLQKAEAVNPGFNTTELLMAGLDLGAANYTEARGREFHRELIKRVSVLPGVQAAAIGRDRPFAGGLLRSVFIEGQEQAADGRGVLVQTNAIGPEFFRTTQIPIIQGREFSESDSETSPMTAIINQAMAEQFWPGHDAIGKRFKLFGDPAYREIVGIARNSKYNSLTEPGRAFLYLPMRQEYSAGFSLYVRGLNPGNLAASVKSAVQDIDPTLPLLAVATMSDAIDRSLSGQRAQSNLLLVFGLIALVLSAIGLYGVMSYSVAQRTREIGIRMALGARGSSVLGSVMGEAAVLVAIGIAVGLLAAFGVTRTLSGLLFGVSPFDLLTLTSASSVLVLVGGIASFLPGRKAMRTNPVLALRHQ